MITAGRFSWGPGGQSPRRLTVVLRASASFLHAEKGRGCASMTFFAGLRFHARTDRHTRLFQVWPEGHLLSSHEERRQRRAKGLPLGAPGNFVDFLFRKIDMNAATLSTDIKRAAAQGLELLSFFGPAPNRTPGAPGPKNLGWFLGYGFAPVRKKGGRRTPPSALMDCPAALCRLRRSTTRSRRFSSFAARSTARYPSGRAA